MNYFTSILSHEKPLKFLTAKILIRTNLCRFFTIRQSHYTLKFFPTALSQNKWINQNFVHAADDPFLQHYIKNGDKIIDVGANIGTVTLLASALIGNSGTVYSIEPHPKTFNYLQENLKFNNTNNVVSFNLAIGDKNSTIGFSDKKSDDQNQVTFSNTNLTVPLKKLDDLDIQEDIIDLLKIDSMGFEKFVLLGSKNILEKTRCIQLPISGSYPKFFQMYGYEYEEILQILRKHNFEIFEYNNKKNLFHLDSNSIPKKGDLLAISDIKNFVKRTNYTIM
jgi:FkbM family methyltransferase